MSNEPKKNTYKISLPKFKFSLKKFDQKLIGLFLIVQLLLLGLTFYKNSYQFNYTYVRNYFIQLIIIYIAVSVFFFFAYRDYVKKNLYFTLYAIYLFLIGLLGANIVGLNALVENLTNRDFFSNSNYIFVTLFLILVFTLISKYDFPNTENFKEFYIEAISHFKRNIGVFLALALIVALLSFYVETFVYAISFVLIIDSIYLAKAFLANIRK